MTLFFYSVHELLNIFVSDCFVNFFFELDCFDSVNHFFFELINSLQMFCWSFLSVSSLCLLNCIFNFEKSSAAWVLLDEFDQWHCEIHKLLYKIHEIINVYFNVWKHVESFKHVQMLCVNYNFLLVHFFSTMLLF